MSKYNIVIIGGGIAGLTVAHELSKYPNLKIAVIDKESIIGGMARSDIYPDKKNLRTEHSWRGYAPFYTNTFQIMKEIPFNGKTVFENLKPNINFNTVETNINPNKNTTLYDMIILVYWILYQIFSGYKRSENNKEISYNNCVSSKISTNAKKKYIESIGPGLGLDPESASLYHIGRYFEMYYLENNTLDSNWYFTNRPTSEAWFDPWYQYLKNKNVDFYLSSELQELQFVNNTVVSAKVSDQIITGNTFILALNPYALTNLYKNNKLGSDPELDKFKKITAGGEHIQISFRLGFSDKIIMDNRDAFIFSDSNLNITLYQQDNFWSDDLFSTAPNAVQFPSLWSGTACVTYKKSKLYPDKQCEELTIDQFLEEVIYEISESQEFNQYLYKHNNKNFKDLNIIEKEVWYEWEFIDNRLQSRNKKWVNTLNNSPRPNFKTINYSNLYITGSHCNTGLSLWSMESATESGKRCAIQIIKDYNLVNKVILYPHKRPNRSLYKLDDILYDLNLPTILDLFIQWICIFIIFIILYFIYQFMKNKKIIFNFNDDSQ